MEIYQEATATTTPGRKGVSFLGGGDAARTPLLTRSGRKPLSAHNHNNNRPKGTPFAKGTTSQLLGEKALGGSKTLVAKRNIILVDKENQQDSGSFLLSPTTTMAIAPSASTPNSAQSLRRALRGKSPKQATVVTIGQQEAAAAAAVAAVATSATTVSNARPLTAAAGKEVTFASKPAVGVGGLLARRPAGRMLGGAGALGPPQRVAPKTPNSLLRTELEEDDDSTNEMEESLLVSPPGALWNVLNGVTHNPASASSTGLLIVPPHTAATIHEITTSQKKQKQRKETALVWASPPLQPRSLLQRTPEDDEMEESLLVQSPERERIKPSIQEDDAMMEEVVESPPEEATIPQPRKGVAMDLSTMFSDEKKPKMEVKVKASLESSKPTPPRHLLERLQKPTARSSAALQIETNLPPPSKVPARSVSVALPTKEEEVEVVVKATPRGQGVAMDMTDVFSSSKISQATPPPRLLQRLQKPTASSSNVPKQVGVSKGERVVKAPSVRKMDVPTQPVKEVVPESRGTGFSMDMSTLFSDSTSSSKPLPTPPAHLLKRLEQRTAPKTTKSQGDQKENIGTKANNKGGKVRPKAEKNKATEPSVLKKAPTRVSQPQMAKLEPKSRPPLQKNTKFFPNNSTSQESTLTGKAQGSNAVSFEISAPKENAIIKKTPLKTRRAPKAKSPIKIVREADDWAGKQCDTFVSWLNYTFQPDEDEDGHVDSGRTGLRALVMHRRLAQVRFRAAELFQSDAMSRARNIVQSEIARGRLSIRSDRDLHADLSLRKEATQLLLSYTTPWLRLGLEVMFGECIMPENLQDQGDGQMTPVARLRATLRAFVVEKVLTDSNVLMKYTKGKTNVPSGKFEKLYREEMRTLVLYRLMVLILFLDHAKTENVLDKVPRLFTKASEVKSSKAVLLSFCRNFLSSEGDFIKHLSRIGLKVSYDQDPVDELEFNVTNLATDLRDGGRLTRMTEIITDTPFKSTMRSLRLPAVSRLQKMHNVNVALSKLKDFGVLIPGDLNAHHIVDAHREMVLKLMWSVIAHTCMTKLLAEGQVEHEIENVLRSGQARRKIEGLKARSPQRTTPDKSSASTESPEGALKSLLFRWCKAVCSSFGLHLQNFSDSFSDGKALCYLVHYYHPAVVRMDEILPTSNDVEAALSPEQAVLNERSNSAMVAKRVTELGGIPKMLPTTDSNNPPDEKSILLCLTYLCSRLMESSEEIFATILIQACYRRYRNKILQEKKEAAALVIFQFWCGHKTNYYAAQQCRYAAAVAILEDFVCTNKHGLQRMKRERLQREQRHSAATNIQRCVRGLLGREHFFAVWERENAAIVIQQYYRRYNAELDFLEAVMERDAAICIQTCWRAVMGRQQFQTTVDAAIDVQRFFKGYWVRKGLGRQHVAAMIIQQAWWSWVDYADSQVAAILIQSRWRGISARRYCLDLTERHQAATNLQTVWRGYIQTVLFEVTREVTISIQSVVRGYLARKNLPVQRMSRAAILLQKSWRGFSAQVQYNLDVMDIVSIQSLARARIAQKIVRNRTTAVTCLQGAVRCALSRRTLLKLKSQRDHEIRRNNAAVICQCAVRTWQANNERFFHFTVDASAKIIQRTWRGGICRRDFVQKVASITTIQSFFRSTKALDEYRRTRSAAVSVQACWRRYYAMLNYELDVLEIVIAQSLIRRRLSRIEAQRRRQSVQLLQNLARCWHSRRRLEHLRCQHHDYLERHESAISLQSVARAFLAQNALGRCRQAATKIEASYRMCILRNRFRSMKHAAFNIQALFRGQKERSYRSHLNRQATVIQTAWRCFSSFVKYTLDYGDIVISQSAARRFLARRASLEKRNAVLVLQSVARRYKASLTANEIRQELREQRRMNQSAQCIQAFYRGSVVRQFMWWKNSQASLIQAQYRGRIARVLYELERYDIIIVQSLIRRWLALRAAARTQGCTVKLQSYARMWLAKGTLRQLHMKQQMEMAENVAAVVLQKTYRGYLALRNISALHSMATGIQTSFRRHYWSLWYQMYLVDVVVAQSHVRRWLTRRWFMKAKTCVAILQSKARQLVATREVSMIRTKKKLWENRTLACLNIQRAWRGHVSRKLSTKHASARKIQKTWRCFAAHVDYLVQQIAVIRLQAQFRKYRTQKAYMGTKASLVKFQAVTRGVVERKYLCFLSMSVTRIQTCFRGYSRRVMFGRMRSSATLIQGLVRGFIVRDELEVSHFAAAEIQRVWRGFAQFCDFFVRLDSVIKLQTFFRRVNAVRKCEDLKLAAYADRCFFDKKARIIQSGFRTYVHHLHLSRSAALVQNMARRYIHRRRATRFERGVKRLQAVFRAKATRRRRTKKVTAVVTRLDRANLKARKDPKLQIGYKTRHALNILQNSKSLAEIMDAVKSLETSTRLSSLCCVLFTEADAARILLDLIRSCNRSVPHVELVHCILLTLDNVSQYRQLVASFATCYSAEIFLDKMQMFRDKDGIFCLSVSLLHGIANCNPMVEEFCALHEHLKRLKALHGLSLRRARPSHTTTKRETNKKPNRIKRRENFDRNAAIKVLGVMVDRFEAVVVSPAEVAGRQHFTF